MACGLWPLFIFNFQVGCGLGAPQFVLRPSAPRLSCSLGNKAKGSRRPPSLSPENGEWGKSSRMCKLREIPSDSSCNDTCIFTSFPPLNVICICLAGLAFYFYCRQNTKRGKRKRGKFHVSFSTLLRDCHQFSVALPPPHFAYKQVKGGASLGP